MNFVVKFDDMATANVKSGLNVCSICFEDFKRPKYLPCLHSYCESCIGTYFTSEFDKQGDSLSEIACPICRKAVEKPQGVSTAEEWAKQLPVNHLLLSMMEISNFEKRPKECFLCEGQGKTGSATSWCTKCQQGLCDNCLHLHELIARSDGHKIVNISDISSLDPTTLSADVPCDRHPKKKIEAYCFDHHVPCCVSCVMINHRKCDKVEDSEKAATELRSSNIYTKMEEDFLNIKSRLEVHCTRQKANIEHFQFRAFEIRSQISELRRKINAHLDNIQSNVEQDLAVAEKQRQPEMEERESSLSGDIKRVDTR